MRFQVQNYVKYLKSKNDLQKPLGALINELWAIYVFLKMNNNNWRKETHVEETSLLGGSFPIEMNESERAICSHEGAKRPSANK